MIHSIFETVNGNVSMSTLATVALPVKNYMRCPLLPLLYVKKKEREKRKASNITIIIINSNNNNSNNGNNKLTQ